MRQQRHGFTLVELVVALTVAGFVVAVAVPVLRTGPPATEKVVLEFVRVVNRARRAAIERGARIELHVGLRTGDYRVVTDAVPDARSIVLRRGVLPIPATVTVRAAGSAEWAEFGFTALGRATGPAIHVDALDSPGRIIRMDPWIGRVDAALR